MGSLGWFPNACTGSATEDVNNSSGQSSEGQTDDEATTSAPTDSPTDADEVTATDSTSTDEPSESTPNSPNTGTDSAATDGATPSGPAAETDTSGTDDSTATEETDLAPAPSSETDVDPTPPANDSGTDEPSADGGSPGPTVVATCAGSTPVTVGSADPDASEVATGLETCSDGVVHRPLPVTCPDNLAQRADLVFTDGGDSSECTRDADCDARPFGRCIINGQLPEYVCDYGCVSDDDCGADQLCQCGADIGTCVSAECQSAADCGDGLLCSRWIDYVGIGCGEPPQFACQSPDDACGSDADCGDSSSCAVVDGSRECKPIPGVACGRPFIVRGSAVLANLVWSEDCVGFSPIDATNVPDVARLSVGVRTRLAEHWAHVGLMEHASIAAFARFCLQLMHVGAPLSLLKDSQRAMMDETLHAELAFSLASTYADRPIAAGSLSMEGALDAVTIDEILRLVIHEGCVGETVAALEAAEARLHCQDDTVRTVLGQIREDETRHAQLAWRFVEWATTHSTTLARVAADEFQRLAHSPSEPDETTVYSSEEARILRHGVLPQSLRAEIRRAALKDVVLPCAERLLERASQPSAEWTESAA